MPMLVLLLALAPLTAASAQERPAQEPARCRPGVDRVQARPEGPARPRPLMEMPDARSILTVHRQVDGCDVLLVKEGSRIMEEPVGAPELRRVFRP